VSGPWHYQQAAVYLDMTSKEAEPELRALFIHEAAVHAQLAQVAATIDAALIQGGMPFAMFEGWATALSQSGPAGHGT
jgi:hypothetical protein